MAKRKRKLTSAEKRAKARRKQEFETIFLNGKMKRVRRRHTIDGMDAEELMLRNADPIWLHQNGLWHYIQDEPVADDE